MQLLGQTECKFFQSWLYVCYVISYWYWCIQIFRIFKVIVVRSDQGGSRNLFSIQKYKNENKSFHVTLVSDDSQHFGAHKGSNHKSYNVKFVRIGRNKPGLSFQHDTNGRFGNNCYKWKDKPLYNRSWEWA